MFSQSLVVFSIGYIFFDLVIIFVDIKDFSELGLQNIAHHFIAIMASSCSFWTRSTITQHAAATIFTEISTIVLHIRFYMIKSGNSSGTPFILVMLIFIASFAYSRMWVQMKMTYSML